MRMPENIDFTPAMYRRLLESLSMSGYLFRTFEEHCLLPGRRVVLLRHDVDRKPENALLLAKTEAAMGIRGSYHFRMTGSSNVPAIIGMIAELGHEIAYHYEDLSAAAKAGGEKGKNITDVIVNRAWDSFRANLDYFRKYYPVRVISMHGSPSGSTDNRLIWKFFDYHECDIICEPYFDVDCSEMVYLTDTGRRWDGERYSVRDKAVSGENRHDPAYYDDWKTRPVRGSLLDMTAVGDALRNSVVVHSTGDIISLLTTGSFNGSLAINTHPQRWNGLVAGWVTELIMQALKNQVKRGLIEWRRERTAV
jgi:hypothetical protein